MGRSVSYPSGAFVTFAETPEEETYCATCCTTVRRNNAGIGVCSCPDDGDMEWTTCDTDWRDLCECWSDDARRLWPSMHDSDRWIGREDHVIAENGLAVFGVSEYCGMMAFWLLPKDDVKAVGERWCRQVFPKLQETFGTFAKIGHMSNGEGVFSRLHKD